MLGFKYIQNVNGITRYYLTNTGNLTIDIKNNTPMKSEYCMEVCFNTTLTMTGKLPYETFLLQPKGAIKFVHDGANYSFRNQSLQDIDIQNIVSLINTCKLLDTFSADSKIDEIKVAYLTDYSNLDKNLISSFAQQNNMKCDLQAVDLFIKGHPSESSDVTNELTQSESSFSLTPSSSQELSNIESSIEGEQTVPLGETAGHPQ